MTPPWVNKLFDLWCLVYCAVVHYYDRPRSGKWVHFIQKITDEIDKECGVERPLYDRAMQHAGRSNRGKDRITGRHIDISQIMYLKISAPFSSRKELFTACTKAFQSPGLVPEVSTTITCTFVDKYKLLGCVICAHSYLISCSKCFVPFESFFWDLIKFNKQIMGFAGKEERQVNSHTCFNVNPTAFNALQIVDSLTSTPHLSHSIAFNSIK